ncbi:bcl-2-binding component 3, isoforms 3/4-like [Manis pentadactyla]|uniref:bcl-2-binding component 3, isoforms 3/4-like n=1 Tax=Manis pentadactyla TaxID=143292 RepID=UPI00255CAAAF|nr:bcl-2-binding component 3, isoforms 3/4-like [Manis pentadactyla]
MVRGAGGCWALGSVTWRNESGASGSAAPRHLPARAARACSLGPASTSSPAKGRGAESWGGARNPGKDPRSFPERKSPLPPRRRKPGGQKGKCSLRAPGGCGGRCLAHRPSGRAPPTARQGPSNLGAFHAWVPAQETARNPGPGPRWPGASLAPAAGGAQPVPVTHFGASAARGARRPRGGAKTEAGPRKLVEEERTAWPELGEPRRRVRVPAARTRGRAERQGPAAPAGGSRARRAGAGHRVFPNTAWRPCQVLGGLTRKRR